MTTCILVIEDDLPSMTLVRYLLDSAGYRTIFAESGQDGAQKAVDASPDLILCDLQMPIWSGYDVVRHLKTHPAWRRVPIIAVTASAMTGDREEVLAAGFDGYISKPIVPEWFVAEIEAFLPRDACYCP